MPDRPPDPLSKPLRPSVSGRGEIKAIEPAHHKAILHMNREFVHWLSPWTQEALGYVLARADYARQIHDGAGVLIGYRHDVDYPDHKNLDWLRAHFEQFFYIDRIIIARGHHGKGLGRALYLDFEHVARRQGLPRLVCEVNIKPDNPASHRFHQALGFHPIGEQDYPRYDVAVRYYEKRLI